ncbi:DUF3784 domain-containing protein [Enterococcus gallinarum]|nr:DUF3784 domain-containing protein [Enterococcus gallinarum]UJA24169.1 DUF3784 domain-containing protein [Enterococcus gallinarum]
MDLNVRQMCREDECVMGNTTGWLVVGLFFITGILFLSRHGWQLIAGYNMASEEKKAQYDLDRLYVANGIGMLVLGAFILLSLLFSDHWSLMGNILFVATILLTIVGIIIINGTWCVKK